MSNAATGMVVKCKTCGANNRVSPERAAALQAICGQCKEPLPALSAEPVIVTDANFAAIVEGSPIPVLLDLWAAWCGPCRVIAPTIETLAKELCSKVLVGKVDVDSNKTTAARFGVQSIPTLLILKGGNEVGRVVGLQSKEAILMQLQPFLAKN